MFKMFKTLSITCQIRRHIDRNNIKTKVIDNIDKVIDNKIKCINPITTGLTQDIDKLTGSTTTTIRKNKN